MTGVTLEALFKFQDDAATQNTANSVLCRSLLEFVREAVTVLTDVFGSMRFAEHKQHTPAGARSRRTDGHCDERSCGSVG